LPLIVKTIAEKMGLVPTTPSIEEIEEIIKGELEANMLQIVARRVFDRTTIKLSISIQKNVLSNIQNEQELGSISKCFELC
jgi:hypothetical protein